MAVGTSKADLQREIRALRLQMDRLEKRCKEREDKVLWVIEVLEPFFDVMTSAQVTELRKKFDQLETGVK